MSMSQDERIAQSRILLQNPYAYLDGDGDFVADLHERKCVSAEEISKNRLRLENPFAFLNDKGIFDAVAVDAVKVNKSFKIDIDEIRNPALVGKRIRKDRLEKIVKNFQNALWKNRRAIWGDAAPSEPIDVLDPAVAFRVLGYEFEEATRPIGEMKTPQGMVEVAGMIDGSRRYAAISSQIPFHMRQFTSAHELGHALLHPPIGLHRDRSLDGSPVGGPRDPMEKEADSFAALFLMPANLVISEFEKRFGEGPFKGDDDTSFALISGSYDALLNKVKNTRGLARAITEAEHFGRNRFDSLADCFGVSREALAIRLEELGLIEL